jgi:HlyD family secretion protein
MQSRPADPDVVAKLGIGKRRGARRWLVRLLILAAVVAVAGGIFAWRARAEQGTGERFVTELARMGDLRETVTATGTLSPLDAVEVGAEVTARVAAVHVDLNDPVTKGQILVELDTDALAARVEESQAQLRSAQASQATAKSTVAEAELKAKRTRALHERGLASDQELEAADAALERAKVSTTSASAQITVASAGLKSATTNRDKTIIRSPIDGIVLARSVEPGQTVTSGLQTPVLLTLAKDLRNMKLKIDVDEADIGRVQEGQRATFVVDAHPKQEFSSKVVRLSNLPKTGTSVVTYEAELSVDNAERLLRPGMTATATIVVSEKTNVLSVPNAALRFRPASESSGAPVRTGLPLPGLPRGPRVRGVPGGRGGGQRAGGARGAADGAAPESSARAGGASRDAVWVLAGGAPRRVPVSVGATDGRRTEVTGDGLSAGTPVIVDVVEEPK